MARPYGKDTWQTKPCVAKRYGGVIWYSHIAKPYGNAIMAELYGRAIWQSHVAEPCGIAEQSHMAVVAVAFVVHLDAFDPLLI